MQHFDRLLKQAARFYEAVRRPTGGSGKKSRPGDIGIDSDLVRALTALDGLRSEDEAKKRPKSSTSIDNAWKQARNIVASGCAAIREYEIAFRDCQFAAQMMDPLAFSQSFDIVVTSFSTLKKELGLA